jgi:hypothetical protein
MLKCIITLYDLSLRTIKDSSADRRMTWGVIKTSLRATIQKVRACVCTSLSLCVLLSPFPPPRAPLTNPAPLSLTPRPSHYKHAHRYARQSS